MSERDNIGIAEKYFEALSAHDFRRACAHHGDGFQFEAPGLRGPVGEKENEAYFQEQIDGSPDMPLSVTGEIAQGDYPFSITSENDKMRVVVTGGESDKSVISPAFSILLAPK